MRGAHFLLPLLLGCGDPDGSEPGPVEAQECDAEGEARAVVIRRLWFVRQEGGVSDGFDLDGADGGPDGCGIADLAAPDGGAGVDNAFSYLLPALELTEAAAVESLVQQAIDGGSLLITVDLRELDDPSDDACVDLSLGRASGVPMLGTDGQLLPGQTLDRDPDAPGFLAEDAALAGGVLVSDFEITLPVTIFDVDLEFQMLDGRLRAELQPDGSVTGVFSGGVDVDYLLSIALEENVDRDLHGILEALLDAWADLAPDETGRCTRISIAFGYEAVPVFFFDE